MKNQKFSHKTPHLKGKQHQLDPNLDLKQSIYHATTQYVDWDNDGDVDEYDKKPKLVPDENPNANFATTSKKLIAKEKGEIKHTRRGVAYEDLRNWFDKDHPEGNWKRYNTKGEAIGPCAREPGEPKPKCLSNEKAAKMSKDEIAAAVKRKRKSDPVADRPGKGGKPKMVSNKIEEQSEERRYCPMCKKKERRMECSYGPAMWDAVTVGKKVSESKKAEPDHEYSMARSELSTIERAVKRLKSKMKGEGNIEAWVQSKITKAADYIDAAADYLDSGEHNVHDSMDEEKNTCWKGYKRKKGTKKYSPGSCVEEEYVEEKNSPTNPKLWAKWKSKAKAKFDVYPCVPLDSQAITKEGLKSYEELQVGEDILTYNIENDILEWNQIDHLHFYEQAPLKRIYKKTGFSIRATENHKWVVRSGNNYQNVSLVETKDIHKRMRLITCAELTDNSKNNLFESNWSKKDNWVEKVLSWNKEQREVYLASSIIYDGHDQGGSAKIKERHTFGFTQKNNDHFWAAILSAYLNGYYTSFYEKTDYISGATIIRNKKFHSTQNLIIEDDGVEDVWCPTTKNNTWVMVQNGLITITGNSAYANGWAAKGYKSEGGGWKSVEEQTIEDLNGNTFLEIVDVIKPDPIKKIKESTRIPTKTGNIILVTANWRGKYYMMKLFFPQVAKPSRQEVQDQIQKVYPGARVQSYYISDIKPGEQFLQVEDWQKVNRQDKTDGLSQKAVDAYRRENPGSKLQTAVTEKNPEGKRAERRKSFCSRMKGMKNRLTSAETARDPDSRINKALRRWNCN